MTQARADERPIERLRLEWEAPDQADERAIAGEAVGALLAFAGAWLEPLAIELRVGCYDREIFTEGKLRPAQPFHLLVAEPRPAEVRIRSMYHSIESHAPALSSHEVQAWVDRALSQSCGADDRHQISLRELEIRASRTRLPAGWTGESLSVECYAGAIAIPVELRNASGWIAAPPAGHGLHQPVELSVANQDGSLRLAIDVYWSPWVGQLGEAVAGLAARGWTPPGS